MATTQEKLNQALKDSGGEWTNEVNELAKQRDAEKGQVWDASSQTYSSTGGGSSGNSGGNIVTNYAESHGLNNASYSVGADGKGDVSGGITNQGFFQGLANLPKVAILSITDPVSAAKLNPYFVPNDNYDPNDPNSISGHYDMHRDVNGDGVPDYDSSGNTINPSDFATWENGGNYKTLTDANGKITGYQKVKADGSPDNDPPTNAAGQPEASDFEKMAQEAEAEAEKKLSEMSYADLIDAGYTEQQAKDILEGKFVLNPKASLSTQTEDILLTDGEGTTVDPNADKFDTNIEGLNVDATTAGDATTITNPTQPDTVGYTAETVSDEAATMKVDTTKGKVNAEDLVDPDGYLIDMDGVATGVNKDGSINQTGIAIANYANQSLTTVIDTSTISGQAAAAALGEGNYIDSKATTQGQIAILSKFFVDANGNPKIPTFAQGLSREVARTISMKGVSGTAAMGAMSAALMESMIPIASEDAAFFQTLTTKNLDNKQEAIINKAKVLARFDEINLSARETAAVQNAKHFFEMNLENLTIENEHAVIEFQGRLDALFEDAKAINTERMFLAEETNDANQFWGELGVRVQEYNANAIDTMKRWNAGEINDIAEFNATMQNNREEFYKNMQYNIEIANARWRQTIMETNTQNKFDAAAEDARNMFGITKASLDQIWDTVDSILANAWLSEDNALQRENNLAVAALGGRSSSGGGIFGALGRLAGTLLGTETGAAWITKMFSGWSDVRLKENIEKIDEINGINIYRWDWNQKAIELGASEEPKNGVLAQEIEKIYPEAVKKEKGYLKVNYGRLANAIC